ncbi:MAG: helix-turn-helix domain-containing protein [Firmicutes bacterium]|nr:helix-turn-helix domain-containing protein [Bacillota bacterium]
MAVFRVEKTKDYTVMSNHHLRDANLSLKAKGLLSLMLSLPETWNYTLTGLAKICKEGVDSIRSGVKELEEQGYIERHRVRNEKGQLTEAEYIIREYPLTPTEPNKPTSEPPAESAPVYEVPTSEKSALDKTTQLNIDTTNVE